MSFYDYRQNKIIHFEDEPYPNYPGWILQDCGCSNGLEWGGTYPRECKRCNGSGWIAKHIESGVIAQYPGGPFC